MQLAHLAEFVVMITLSKDTYFVAPHWGLREGLAGTSVAGALGRGRQSGRVGQGH